MVKAVIHFTLIVLAACSVLAAPTPYQRREVSGAPDILEERDYTPTMFERDDFASLQEREPLIGLLGLIGKVGLKIGTKFASRAGSHIRRNVKKRVNQPRRRNNRRKRDLEAEDELDLAAREDMNVFEREMKEDDVFGREVEEDLYLD